MTIEVRFFSTAREATGCARDELDLADGASVADAWACLAQRWPALDRLEVRGLALNREFVTENARLCPGDELAVIPPVCGG